MAQSAHRSRPILRGIFLTIIGIYIIFIGAQLVVFSRINVLPSEVFDFASLTTKGGPASPLFKKDSKSSPSSVADSTVANGAVDYDYDLVTVVHHDDMRIMLEVGLESWLQYFVSSEKSRIYAICTPEAFDMLQKVYFSKEGADGADKHSQKTLEMIKDRLVIVSQDIFPFSLTILTKYTAAPSKPTWIYQQLLKLYTYRALRGGGYPLRELFLIVDSDTAAVRPTEFLSRAGGGEDAVAMPVYNVASLLSGAFRNDCVVGDALVKELFHGGNLDGSMSEAFPFYKERIFTSISHTMLFNGTIVDNMLNAIESIHKDKAGENLGLQITPAWSILSSLKTSVLSEWELYMAWIMKYHRGQFLLKQTPYVNWGDVTSENLSWLRNATDVHWATNHDDFRKGHICCVNSNWSKMKYPEEVRLSCPCCADACEHVKIDCDFLGIQGCRDLGRNLMIFD